MATLIHSNRCGSNISSKQLQDNSNFINISSSNNSNNNNSSNNSNKQLQDNNSSNSNIRSTSSRVSECQCLSWGPTVTTLRRPGALGPALSPSSPGA